MKWIINFVLFFTTISSFAQTNGHYYDFEFYKNGSFYNTKKLKVQLVKDLDTIACEVAKDKLLLPDISGNYTVVVNIKKDKYIIANVDFSKLYRSSTIVFGIENDFSHFLSPESRQYPTIYTLPKTLIPLQIEHLEEAKAVHFVIFTSEKQDGKMFKEVSSYSRYTLVKKDAN